MLGCKLFMLGVRLFMERVDCSFWGKTVHVGVG